MIKTHSKQAGFGVVVVIAVVALLALAGGGAYMASQGKFSSQVSKEELGNSNMDDSHEDEKTDDHQPMETTMRSLLSKGENLVCTFSRIDDESDIQGTVYISGSGGEIRGDYTIQTRAVSDMEAHMVKQNNTIYAWSSMSSQGTMMSTDENAPAESESSSAIDMDEKVEFKCDSWNPDPSKFELPSNIEFMDMSAMMESQMEATGSINTNQCSACNAIPNETAKQQCLTSLGCN